MTEAVTGSQQATIDELVRSHLALIAEVADLRTTLQALPGYQAAAKLIYLLGAISQEFGDSPWSIETIFEAAADSDLLAGDLDPAMAINQIIEVEEGKRGATGAHQRLGSFLSKHLGVYGRWRLELVPGQKRKGNRYRVTLASAVSRGAGASVV